MNTITLRAHFDGQQICLDEPCELPPNAKLIVTVVAGDSMEEERQAWLAGFARAYREDEPDYSTRPRSSRGEAS